MTLGERNNNPLNIRRVKGQRWKGELPLSDSVASPLGEVGRGAFCRFESMEYGLRAAFCILRTYRNKYHAVCIEDIIKRWAPPSENDTAAYIRHVCRLTWFGGRERLTESEWPQLVRAMAFVECGVLLSEETVNKGYQLYKNLKP